MKKLFLLTFCSFTFIFSFAQLATNNIYLFNMEQQTGGQFFFSSPKFLTFDNHQGYNNQPNFINDLLYITVQTSNDTTQTDIFSLDLNNWIKTRVTATKESEYSPTAMPDGKNFSVVRVEKDGSQRLWALPIDQQGTGRVLFEDVKNVGYHYWLNESTVALFLVGQPHQLALGNIQSQDIRFITSNIGRSFQKLPNGNLAFIYKCFDNKWSIRELSRDNFRTRDLMLAQAGSEDFVTLPDGTFIMGKGSKLFKYNINTDTYWVEIANLAPFGVFEITRLAYKNNQLAVVTSE